MSLVPGTLVPNALATVAGAGWLADPVPLKTAVFYMVLGVVVREGVTMMSFFLWRLLAFLAGCFSLVHVNVQLGVNVSHSQNPETGAATEDAVFIVDSVLDSGHKQMHRINNRTLRAERLVFHRNPDCGSLKNSPFTKFSTCGQDKCKYYL